MSGPTGPTGERRCTEVIEYFELGATAEDDRDPIICGKPAEFLVSRSGIRPKARCGEHAEQYRNLPFDDIVFERLS